MFRDLLDRLGFASCLCGTRHSGALQRKKEEEEGEGEGEGRGNRAMAFKLGPLNLNAVAQVLFSTFCSSFFFWGGFCFIMFLP